MREGLVIVGECNPYVADPRLALFHLPRKAAGNRLRTILGLPDYAYVRLNKLNLCTGKWSMKKAREEASKIRDRFETIVCLGVKVAEAMGVPPMWSSVTIDGQTIASLPHPSGRNLLWNNPWAKIKAVDLMRHVAPHIQWGQF